MNEEESPHVVFVSREKVAFFQFNLALLIINWVVWLIEFWSNEYSEIDLNYGGLVELWTSNIRQKTIKNSLTVLVNFNRFSLLQNSNYSFWGFCMNTSSNLSIFWPQSTRFCLKFFGFLKETFFWRFHFPLPQLNHQNSRFCLWAIQNSFNRQASPKTSLQPLPRTPPSPKSALPPIQYQIIH